MKQMVITVVGDDRAGLVEVLSGAILRHDGNWDSSHMAELAGKFAGVVLVQVPVDSIDALTEELEQIESKGLLHISMAMAERGAGSPVRAASKRIHLLLVGQDHPGIVHEISQALAARNVSIDELATSVGPAPMGGQLFQAEATLVAPASVAVDEVQDILEALAQDLMVDLELSSDEA